MKNTTAADDRVLNGADRNLVGSVKAELRAEFDEVDETFIHFSDTTDETWQYVEVCFPDQAEMTRNGVNAAFQDFTNCSISHNL
jgi:hypothetical protein